MKKKPKKELSPADIAFLEEKKKKRDNAQKAMSILRGISIRIPLLIYGANVAENEDITKDNFVDLIDDVSWAEFMPTGVTKELYKKFAKYYEEDVFVAAGRQIRNLAKSADELSPTERVGKISQLFAMFKNPDKETVLTPWRVVNMHIGDCLGGYSFFNENYTETIIEPRFIDQGQVTKDTLTNINAKILEINSKTGLYPLYVAYSIYRTKLEGLPKDKQTIEKQKELWKDTVEKNIFVICKTPMAKAITKRTLLGYRQGKTNAHAFDDLINQLKDKPQQFIEKVTRGNFWNKEEKIMKFDAVVGNPPYQAQDSGVNTGSKVSRTSAIPVYQHFVSTAKKMQPDYVSLIIPSRWMTGGRGLDEFRKENIKDQHYSLIHDYENDQEIFPNTDIGGGIMYFLWSKNHNEKLSYFTHKNGTTKNVVRFLDTGDNIVVRDYNSAQILKKITKQSSFATIVSSRKPFGFAADITRKNPDYFSNEQTAQNNVKFFAWDGVPCTKFTSEELIKNKILLDSWKVFISKTADPPIRFGRENKEILRKPFLGIPKSACSETYLAIGTFDNQTEANNVMKYIKTMFFRFLVLQKKKTQNVSKDVFEFVPLQDFTETSDIDWSKPISEIDLQLYKKYRLSQEEIDFIETNVKPME